MAEPRETIPPEALTALQQGNKIEAIKIVRLAHKIDLKEAKDRVDAYVESEPALRQRFAAAQAEIKGKLVRWLILIALALLGYYFFAGGWR